MHFDFLDIFNFIIEYSFPGKSEQEQESFWDNIIYF